jgi:uncharacterized protein (DUF302 family)
MLRCCIVVGLVLAMSSIGWAEADLSRKASPHSVEQTAERFEAAARARGLHVFPRIDHAAAAREYGLEMPPTLVIGFGNPRYGTPFMLQRPESGIDFPPRAIVYEDANGQVWLAYNTASYLYEHQFARHGLDYPPGDLAFFRNVVEGLAEQAIGNGQIGD